MDLGADAFLTRVPDAVGLCAELGLRRVGGGPNRGEAMLWTHTGLAPMPRRVGARCRRDPLGYRRSTILSRLGISRAALDRVLPAAR